MESTTEGRCRTEGPCPYLLVWLAFTRKTVLLQKSEHCEGVRAANAYHSEFPPKRLSVTMSTPECHRTERTYPSLACLPPHPLAVLLQIGKLASHNVEETTLQDLLSLLYHLIALPCLASHRRRVQWVGRTLARLVFEPNSKLGFLH